MLRSVLIAEASISRSTIIIARNLCHLDLEPSYFAVVLSVLFDPWPELTRAAEPK